MTIHNDLNAPWSLHFDRDGTEDFAVILDAAGDELLRSRHFWLLEGNDPVPPTLAAMWLVAAAPELLGALEAILPYAQNENVSLYECCRRDGGDDAKEELAACEKAIEEAIAVIAKAEGGIRP